MDFINELNMLGGPIIILYIVIITLARRGMDFAIIRIVLDLIEHVLRIMFLITVITFINNNAEDMPDHVNITNQLKN